jgi:integrase
VVYYTCMGRRRKAWLWGGTGVRIDGGVRQPGFYVRFYEYTPEGRVNRSLNFLTAKESREWVKQFNAKADLQLLGKVVPVHIVQAVGEFMEGKASLAKNSRIHYRLSLAMFTRKVGERNVCEYKGTDIDRFISARIAESASGPTIAKDLRAVGAFFNWSVKRKYAGSNPLEDATSLPDGRTARDRPIVSESQIVKLVQSLDTEDRRVAVWIGITTGLDRSVIENLSSARIDWDQAAVLKRRPKTKRDVAIPLHPDLLSLLRERARQRPAPLPLLVGLSRQEKHEDWWHRATAAAGVPGLLFRDLRAVASSRAQRSAGLSLRDSQEMLGHASIRTTAEHYHMPDPAVRSKLDRLPLPGFPGTEESKRKKP